MATVSKINVTVPGTSPTAGADFTIQANLLQAQFPMPPANIAYLHYSDSSPAGHWAYYVVLYSSNGGNTSVVMLSMTGTAHPASGSGKAAAADPGLAGYTSIGAPLTISVGDSISDGGSKENPLGGAAPIRWIHVPGNSTTLAADMVSMQAMVANDIGRFGSPTYYKYVDKVTGAWVYYDIYPYVIGAGAASPPSPAPWEWPAMAYTIITCSGTPNPPTGSPHPAVPDPGLAAVTWSTSGGGGRGTGGGSLAYTAIGSPLHMKMRSST